LKSRFENILFSEIIHIKSRTASAMETPEMNLVLDTGEQSKTGAPEMDKGQQAISQLNPVGEALTPSAAASKDSSLLSSTEHQVSLFEHMRLQDNLLRGIFAYGFEKPSDIQRMGIPPLLARKDAILQAQSGMGKTGCFCVAALQLVDKRVQAPQALLLSPTRELAQQTYSVLSALNYYLRLSCHLFIGGSQMAADLKALRDGVHIAVGTPGRICALVDRHQLSVDSMRLVVLDEADQLLAQGFQDSMRFICRTVPASTQICLVSATVPDEVRQLSDHFLREPVEILMEPEKVTLEGIQQYYVQLEQQYHWPLRRGQADDKFETLCELFERLQLQQTIVFCNTRRTAEWLATRMQTEDYVVSCIHADLDASQRNSIMQQFRLGSSRVLISTDLTARGIDVQGVSLVVNFEIPRERETYIHRIGRSGRYGRRGTAINFVSRSEQTELREIERHYKATLCQLPDDLTSIKL
jgi:translation initiation factor 4A